MNLISMTKFTRKKGNITKSRKKAASARRDIILLKRATVSHPLKKASLTVVKKVDMIIKQRKIKRQKNKDKRKFNNHRFLPTSNRLNTINLGFNSSKM